MLKEKNGSINLNSPLLDGIYKRNTILVSGLVISPVVVTAYTLSNALALITAFSAITFLTIMISSFFPRNIVYTIRIILYTFIAALVYVPVIIMIIQIFPDAKENLGVFIPLIITNSLIISKTELRFFRRTKGRMVIDVIAYIIGFDVVVFIFGFLREILSSGELSGHILAIPLTIPALALPFGGFIALGLLAALLRKIQINTGE